MDPFRLMGVRMADSVDETFVGGLMGYCTALGFILPLVGVEELLRVGVAGGGNYWLWPWLPVAMIGVGIPLYCTPAIRRRLIKARDERVDQKRDAADMALKLNVHKVWVQTPRLDDAVLHINVDFFNGNSFGLHLKGISGGIDVVREDARGNATRIGTLETPTFYESRRLFVLAHDEFAITLAQKLPRPFAEELRSWPENNKYRFNLGNLNIVAQSEAGQNAARLPLWDGIELEKRGNQILANKQIVMRPGSLLRGLSHLLETRE